MVFAGKYLEGTATTSATVGANASVTFLVPSGKTWMYAVVAVAVNATNNEVRIYGDGVLIWEVLTNVTTEQIIDLTSRYPRSLEAITSITANVKTTDGVAKTLTFKVWVLEGP